MRTTIIGGGMTPAQFYTQINAITQAAVFVVKSSESNIANSDYSCDGTDDQVQINLAITAANALTNGGTVVLTDGIFNISSHIVMKSNVRLILNDSTYIKLTNSTTSYMLINDNLSNVTSNFCVKGGTWDGNAANQTNTGYPMSGNPMTTCWQVALLFVNCTDFSISDLIVRTTIHWAVGLFACSRGIMNNVGVWQKAVAFDGWDYGDCIDAIWCQDMLFNNIYGYTSDSHIRIGAYSSWVSWSGAPVRDSKNIIIRNLRGMQDPVSGQWPAALLYIDAGGQTVENINIDGVHGHVNNTIPLVWIFNYVVATGLGIVKNTVIKNIHGSIDRAGQCILAIGTFAAHAPGNNYTNLNIDGLTIDGVNIINAQNSKKTLFQLGDMCKNVNIRNVVCKNSTGVYQHELVSVSPTGMPCKMNISDIDITSDIDPIIKNAGASNALRVNALECYADVLAQVNTPIIGDRLVEKTTFHPMIYTTKWIDVIDGSDI
jgi:hypothetical protein